MGSVYKAIDRRDDSVVAVKLLHEHLVEEESFRERFEREAHVAALLRSPYKVHLLDYGEADGRYFLAMEYMFIFVFGLEDGDGNEIFDYITVDGAIGIF